MLAIPEGDLANRGSVQPLPSTGTVPDVRMRGAAGRHSVPLLLASALLVVLLCELGARLLAPHLPGLGGWHSREVQAQVARIEQRANAGGVNLAFIGSSTIGAALDPEALSEAVGDDWYTAWMAGADEPVIELWTNEIVVPKLDPDFVVLGLTSFELNDAYSSEGLLSSYTTSPGRLRAIGTLSPRDKAIGWLEERSALMALRQYLRSPGELVARLTGRIPNMAPPHGQFDGARSRSYGQEPEGMQRVRGYVREFAVGGSATVSLERAIAELKAQGREVAIIDLPVLESEWAAMHEHGEVDLEAYREVLRDLATRRDVRLFTYAGQFQDRDLYRDPIHLNGRGSEQFSAVLVEDLGYWMKASSGR